MLKTKTGKLNLVIDIPLTINIKDEYGETLGSGSGTISVQKDVQYTYEVPDITDFLVKGSLPAIGIDVLLKKVIYK